MKTRVVMIGIALLAVALVVGSVYMVLRPETVRAEGGRFGRAGAGAAQAEDCTGNCTGDCGKVGGQGGRWQANGAGAQAADCSGDCGKVGGQGRGFQANGADTQTGAQGRGSQADGQGRGTETQIGAQPRAGRGRLDQDVASPERGQAVTPVTWQTIEGRVVEVSEGTGAEFSVQLANGTTAEVGGGPSFYWDEQGYQVSNGDQVRVRGFFEDGEFKAGTVENLTTGQTIRLRDETGRPMWAGRGMGRGR